ncbi:flagellar hook-associated protein 3 FlgL [Oxalobacteraceae bacterium GrIS 1.11]
MRIATSQYQSTINTSIQMNQDRISYLTTEMATGNRIQLPSDDPVGSVRVSRLNREQAIITQYQDNISAVKTRLLKNENYLTSMNNDLGQARDQLVWASDGGSAPADLNAMTSSLQALRDSIFYTANEKDQEGRYMFSGTLTDTPALTYNAALPVGSRYTYSGNQNQQTVVVGNGVTQVANVDVKGMETLLNQMDQTIATLAVPGVNANNPAVRAVLKANLDGTDTAMGMLSSKIAVFGGAQNIISTLSDNHANVSISNQMALHDLQSADMAVAATDLNGYQTALEATYKAYAKVGNLSLFDVI